MRSFFIRGCWWLALMLGAACGPDPLAGGEDASLREDLAADNGSNINGSNINGSNINGSNINGSALGSILTSVSFTNVRLGRVTLEAVELREGELVGRRGGRTWGAERLIGATFIGTLGDGATVTLQLQFAEESEEDEDGDESDIWRYHFAYLSADGQWEPVCPGGVAAVAVPGRWDYRQGVAGGGAKLADPGAFTLGCRGAAVEKCVTAGYRPWSERDGVSLDPLHQACVRLIRADFCGDGKSWTVDGRRINLYDGIGVQHDTEPWAMEAEWDASGARCASPLNRSGLGVMCPGRAPDRACGTLSRFQAGTLLMSEIPQGPSGLFHVAP